MPKNEVRDSGEVVVWGVAVSLHRGQHLLSNDLEWIGQCCHPVRYWRQLPSCWLIKYKSEFATRRIQIEEESGEMDAQNEMLLGNQIKGTRCEVWPHWDWKPALHPESSIQSRVNEQPTESTEHLAKCFSKEYYIVDRHFKLTNGKKLKSF